MAYDINASLERLEQNLKDIDSARYQVERTVESSNLLQSKMTDFMFSMTDLLKNINDLKKELEQAQQDGQKTLDGSVTKISKDCDQIIVNLGTSVQKINDDMLKSINGWKEEQEKEQQKEQKTLDGAVSKIGKDCDQIIMNVGTSLNNASEDFKNKTTSSITLFKDENTKLTEQVAKLDVLQTTIVNSINEIALVKTALDTLLKELKDSQEAQDKILSEIDTKITAISPATKELIDGISEKIQESSDNILTKLNGLDSTHAQMQGILDGIKTTTQTINQTTSNNSSTLTGMQMTQAKANEEFMSAVKTNRWLIIIGFILLAILQFVLTKL